MILTFVVSITLTMKGLFPELFQASLSNGANLNEQVEKLFEPYQDKRIDEARLEGKGVVIDFYADWCAACKELEKLTFTKKEILELKDQFVWLKFDATQPDDKFEKLQKKYQILGLPHLVFYDQNGNYRPELTLTGFEEAPEFRKRLEKAMN